MLRTEKLSDGVETACGRIDELLRQAGPDLGRWMIAVAERYAADSCRRRTMNPAGSRQRAVGGRRQSAAANHRLPTACCPPPTGAGK